MWLAILAACGDPAGGSATTPTGTTASTGTTPSTTTDTLPPGPAAGNVIELTDADNAAGTLALEVGTTGIAPRTDFLVDWSDLVTDMNGRELDPAADVAEIRLYLLRGSAEETVDSLVSGGLGSDVVLKRASVEPEPGVLSLPASAFAFDDGSTFDPTSFVAGSALYLLYVRSAGSEAPRTVHFVVPEDGGGQAVELGPDAARLQVAVDLLAGGGVEAWTLAFDWWGLGTDLTGADLDPLSLDQASVLRYDLAVSDLEADFARWEALAADRWTLDAGHDAAGNLAEAVSESGQPLEGVTADGAWLLALSCSTCMELVPPFVTVLLPPAE